MRSLNPTACAQNCNCGTLEQVSSKHLYPKICLILTTKHCHCALLLLHPTYICFAFQKRQMLFPVLSGHLRAWRACLGRALSLLLCFLLPLLFLPLHVLSKALSFCCLTGLLSCSLLICCYGLEEAFDRQLLWHGLWRHSTGLSVGLPSNRPEAI